VVPLSEILGDIFFKYIVVVDPQPRLYITQGSRVDRDWYWRGQTLTTWREIYDESFTSKGQRSRKVRRSCNSLPAKAPYAGNEWQCRLQAGWTLTMPVVRTTTF